MKNISLNNQSSPPLVESATVAAQGVSITYAIHGQKNRYVAVDSISFVVKKGELVAVVGPSGCGKSTLISAIAGLVPYTSGSIRLCGEVVKGPSSRSGVVFQRALLLPWRTVLENVAIGLEIARVPKLERLSRAAEMLKLVGLEDFASRYPQQLSGGMQQRVNLARALVKDPEVLLLDEPFASLDAQTRETMQEELTRIWKVAGKSGLFITHQIDEAVYLADRVLVMSAGPRATIIDDIPVDFERPRELHVKRGPDFQVLVDRIWDQIKLPKV